MNWRNEGGGVMIWACYFYGKSDLVSIDGSIDSLRYCAVLGTTYLKYIDEYHLNGAILQYDNAPCHTSATL